MSALRREPREVYRVYEEDELLSGEVPVASVDDQLGGSPAPRIAARRRAPLALVAAMVGAIVVAAIEMHASVGRVSQPVRAPHAGAPGATQSRPRARARARHVSRRRAGEQARRGRGREASVERDASARGDSERAAAGGERTAAAQAGTATNVPARVAIRPPSPASQFGFER